MSGRKVLDVVVVNGSFRPITVSLDEVRVNGLVWLLPAVVLVTITLAVGLASISNAIRLQACVTSGESLDHCRAVEDQ